jgi:hypothetical protein
VRRFLFFLGASVAAFSMLPVIDAQLRYVPTVVGCVYLGLAALVGLDGLSHRD